MMVNGIENNVPWQSTVPQQMPWMSSYEPTTFNMQFGAHQPAQSMASLNQANILPQNPGLPIGLLPMSTATTPTLPITTCPTTTPNVLLTSSSLAPYTSLTTTTHSSYHVPTTNLNPVSQIQINQEAQLSSALTQIPQYCANSLTYIPTMENAITSSPPVIQQKRRSFEMEDEQIMSEEPPTKQLLSERKLFKQFGSLHLDSDKADSKANISSNKSDSSDDSGEDEQMTQKDDQTREDFNRYVYLLFKDKKETNGMLMPSNSTMERLAREERDKLSKALVLWNPPLKDCIDSNENDGDDEGDDDEFKYSDHRDFLKDSPRNNDSIIITEVFDDDCDVVGAGDSASQSDDLMLE